MEEKAGSTRVRASRGHAQKKSTQGLSARSRSGLPKEGPSLVGITFFLCCAVAAAVYFAAVGLGGRQGFALRATKVTPRHSTGLDYK